MARRCKQCNTEIRIRNQINPIVTPQDKIEHRGYCSTGCLVQHTKAKNAEAAAKKQRREIRQARQELRRNDLKWQRDSTQKQFNKMRVLQEKLWFQERGLEPECISCGKTNMDWCCGHLKTRGSSPELALDPKNTFLQCNRNCNMMLSGNINGNKTSRGYLAGLLERFGEDEGQSIIDYVNSHHEPKRYKADDYERMRAEFAAEARRLEKLLNSA